MPLASQRGQDLHEELAITFERWLQLQELLGRYPPSVRYLGGLEAKLLRLGVDEPPVQDEAAVIGWAFPHFPCGCCDQPELFADLPDDSFLLRLTGLDPATGGAPVTRHDDLRTAFDHEDSPVLAHDRNDGLSRNARLLHVDCIVWTASGVTFLSIAGARKHRAERVAAAADRRNLIRVMPAKGG